MKARRPLRTNPTVVRLILRTHATRPRRPDALAKPATCPSDAPPPTSVKASVVMSPMRKLRTSQPGQQAGRTAGHDDCTRLRRRQPARNTAGALSDVGRHALTQPHGLPAIQNNRLLERQIRTACASAHSPLIFPQPSAPTANLPHRLQQPETAGCLDDFRIRWQLPGNRRHQRTGENRPQCGTKPGHSCYMPSTAS